MGDRTTVKVSHETWRRLKNRKEPGVSYNEIIAGLLDEAESCEQPPAEGS
jgi:hypothetical protein